MVYTAVLTIDNTSKWGDTITPLENIMKSFHSIMISHDSNNESSASSRCDPTAYPTRKSITALATNNTSSLMRLLFSLSYGESFDDLKEQMTNKSVGLLSGIRGTYKKLSVRFFLTHSPYAVPIAVICFFADPSTVRIGLL